MKEYYVYIIANLHKGTLYTGVTSNLRKRIWEHKSKVVKGFSEKHNIDRLVYFEIYNEPVTAIQREKKIKHWKRQWRIDLIEKDNPKWEDLYLKIL